MQKAFEEDLDPVARADYHKTHGNDAYKKALAATNNIKLRKSHLKKAVECYTEGLREQCRDAHVDSTLLSNRAAANLMLGNCRQVIGDCSQAVMLNRKNKKAYFRAAKACHRISKYDMCVSWCDRGLLLESDNQELNNLRQQATRDAAAQAKEERRRAALERKRAAARAKLDKAVTARGVRTARTRPTEWWDAAAKRHTGEDDADQSAMVHETDGKGPAVDDDGVMHWPVLLAYPEHAQTDFIESFCELDSLRPHLEHMFPDQAEPVVPWDVHNKYKASNLVAYYEHIVDISRNEVKMIPVDLDMPLLQILQQPTHVVYASMPIFIVLVRGSPEEAEFLKRVKK
ncbi:uncharacterized protein MONBRDRAFT_33288 [Monosiga brevicollis MX1]|uniref:Cns1/TTC4 wheel domain-containing protein n=1 Tax=Monosiga brevicollis TaxID=81824 RepID=A9V4K5_MONBE|nr:uncharacterized protein MONBRDRAFT_33288 [Monosiga brevicollis MX1]EDQ87387.1 predicted protein [Monosiga brevicollis MX1]|eukprot:XP_001747647.1 hypothetical protein [Monosiga brevicollis MX1]